MRTVRPLAEERARAHARLDELLASEKPVGGDTWYWLDSSAAHRAMARDFLADLEVECDGRVWTLGELLRSAKARRELNEAERRVRRARRKERGQ